VGLDKRFALRTEIESRKHGGSRSTYIFKCSKAGCEQELRVRCDYLSTHSSLCSTHAHVKRPFESIWNGLKRDIRGHKVALTYEEFVEFTKITNCHYCGASIPWQPYGVVRGKFTSRAYFLDRKDNDKGYSKENCVVCCTQCNSIKSNRFTYDEFLKLAPSLSEIQRLRKPPCENCGWCLDCLRQERSK
jgi:5-methylcytosine-specific restriction endonuclease McrA